MPRSILVRLDELSHARTKLAAQSCYQSLQKFCAEAIAKKVAAFETQHDLEAKIAINQRRSMTPEQRAKAAEILKDARKA